MPQVASESAFQQQQQDVELGGDLIQSIGLQEHAQVFVEYSGDDDNQSGLGYGLYGWVMYCAKRYQFPWPVIFFLSGVVSIMLEILYLCSYFI